MSGQAVERRDVMRLMALAAVASGYEGFRLWSFAGSSHSAHQAAASKPAAGPYEPLFFSQEEFVTLQRLAELIIPNDGTPGAREAGVGEFIDFMAANDAAIQFRFRFGLSWMDSHSKRLHSQRFTELSEALQIEILEHLAYTGRFRIGEEDGRLFFDLVREYTVMGYYTSRVGMEQLDHPGLKLYAESPGCTHLDDPEHRRLPPQPV